MPRVKTVRVHPSTKLKAKSVLKWAGGKAKLTDEILARLPSKIGCYHEPFLGGGAVFFALANEARFDSAILSDSNAELIHFYQVLRNRAALLIAELKKKQRYATSESYYYNLRKIAPTKLPAVKRAARFFFLNRTCFNGLYRVNKQNQFNVPWGKYKTVNLVDEPKLLEASRALRKAVLFRTDFRKAFQHIERGDAVYFDPPYLPASETAGFTSYTADGFGWPDQLQLAKYIDELATRGVPFVLSNAATPVAKRLYHGHQLDRVFAPRAINNKGDKRGKVPELLVTRAK
jgi:DNA adenine methylase